MPVPRLQQKTTVDNLTIGTVVDTNDPQQMGRLRVLCPALGDTEDQTLGAIPWAMYVSPLAGSNTIGTRGTDETQSRGPVSYGFWNLPKVGAQAIIACIDGDPMFRMWLGCVHGQYLPHTLPHGRFTYQGNNQPEGPLTSTGDPVEPLYSNLTDAFQSQGSSVPGTPGTARNNMEFRTRGADYQTASIDGDQVASVESVITKRADDLNESVTEEDGNTFFSSQGYDVSRIDPALRFESTGDNLDSQTYSWTTPGFHSISMDDRIDNVRMRFRSTGGHQIILDDTNERIYISVAKGAAWFELDQDGNIDFYTNRNFSVHAKKDINFITDQSFRVFAGQGIHLHANQEIRTHSVQDTHIKSNQSVRVHANGGAFVEADGDLNMVGHGSTFLSADADLQLDAGGNLNQKSGTEMNLNAGGDMMLTGGPNIHLNGPPATPAVTAQDAAEFEAFYASRVPEHEPWARVMMNLTADQNVGNQFNAEFNYASPSVGKVERGESIPRNERWHR